jgi:hypothetical protein
MSSKKKYIQIGLPIITAVVVLSAFARGWYRGYQTRQWQNRRAEWKITKWPEEKRRTEERVKSRQAENDTTNAATINLKPYLNTELTDAPFDYKGQKADNLSELPAGIHTYGGVPFDVEGSVQLMGAWLRHFQKKYPAKVEGIAINRRCSKLHFLHGASGVVEKVLGQVVEKISLHYDDGSTREINMVAGAQVFDWWLPLYTTGVIPKFVTPAPGSELAWTGSNPLIKKWKPEYSLGLYKSTFENPQPAVSIRSMDFISTETDACPFLVGVTVE